MKMSIEQIVAATGLVLALANGSSQASVITFDDPNSNAIISQQFTSFSVGGLTFTQNGGGLTYVWNADSPNSNGTNNLISAFGSYLAITKTGGGLFDLSSLDLTISWYDSEPTESVLINATPFVLTQGMQTFNLGLTGVSQVNIADIGNNGGYWALDNITFNWITFNQIPGAPAASVPEPTSIWLLGLGFAGFAFSRRKKARLGDI